VFKISIFLCILIFISMAGCGSAEEDSSLPTPITLPLGIIKSKGTIIDQPFANNQVELLETTLNEIISKTQAKGVSASVAKPDDGIWSGSRGLSGRLPLEKITPEMTFYAGSVGKIFTAVVVFNLIEEGRLSLESPIARWFPEITQANKITINHLLTHTSGIPSYDNAEEFDPSDSRYLSPEEIVFFIKDKGLLFEPGKHYSYSNTGYLMLGIIIEQATGITYKEAVEQYIIKVIGLQATKVLTPQSLEQLEVNGHHNGEVLTEKLPYALPFAAGTIIAAPTDLILFFQALMSGGLLSQDSLQGMFSDMNLTAATQSSYYGKGIVAAIDTPIGDIIGHTGSTKGFGAALYYHPKENVFVSVMMNDDIKPIEPAMFRLMEAMMVRRDKISP